MAVGTVFPARVSGPGTARLGTVKASVDGDRLRVWAQQHGQVELVIDLPGPVIGIGRAAWMVSTPDGDVTLRKSSGCGCGLSQLKRFVVPALEPA